MNEIIVNNSYGFVDLDLPSGTLWATCNVGANRPSDSGLYFQWGDTVGYAKDQIGKDKQFNLANYKWNPSGDGKTFTKYNKTDNKNVLDLEDDAANANMGGSWHMPTPTQIQELINETTSDWAKIDNVNGRLFTSKKDSSKSIFIPAAGYAWDGSVGSRGSNGNVWSSVLSSIGVRYGKYLGFGSGVAGLVSNGRGCGFSVRGVIDKNNDNSNGNKINMEKNDDLNIVKILKDAPKGTKLWSPICGECELVAVRYKSIDCKTTDSYHYYVSFTSSGKFGGWVYNNGECIVFPSKDNRDWSTFKVSKKHKHFEPFQKVLVAADCDDGIAKKTWCADLYGHYDSEKKLHYCVGYSEFTDDEIIPYEDNEDKLGTLIETK